MKPTLSMPVSGSTLIKKHSSTLGVSKPGIFRRKSSSNVVLASLPSKPVVDLDISDVVEVEDDEEGEESVEEYVTGQPQIVEPLKGPPQGKKKRPPRVETKEDPLGKSFYSLGPKSPTTPTGMVVYVYIRVYSIFTYTVMVQPCTQDHLNHQTIILITISPYHHTNHHIIILITISSY